MKRQARASYACNAIAARIHGVWDNPTLADVGPMSGNLQADIESILMFYDVTAANTPGELLNKVQS